MTYREKTKFCRSVNSDPIYQEYSKGIRCNCYQDVNHTHFLEVIYFGYHTYFKSAKCNDWEEDFMLEWIIESTRQLKLKLGLGDYEI